MGVTSVELREVGPREGMQFEGIDDPKRVSTKDKIRLIDALSDTGLRTIEVTSFVHPKHVPQMADAEEVVRGITPRGGVRYEGLYLNERGLLRALATDVLLVEGRIILTASEAFLSRNQRRTMAEDLALQRKQLDTYVRLGVQTGSASMMAAFGCNYEGPVPLERVVALVDDMVAAAADAGVRLRELRLADTMGWATPKRVKSTVEAIRDRWPDLELAMHFHDTRGAGMANFYASLEVGVTKFDTSVGGLGGCPFAGTVAGNIATEDVVFLCHEMGIETGIDLDAIGDCARLAEEIVGHELPSRMARLAGAR